MEESTPLSTEKKEQAPITEEQCIEAMKAENFELVRTWYAEQEKIAEADPSIEGHMQLTIRMAELQVKAGLFEYARQTLEDAYQDAYQQGNDELAGRIANQIDQLPQ